MNCLKLSEAERFLLNDVTATEREQFEERALLEDDFFASLVVEEDALLDASVRGELADPVAERLTRRELRVVSWPERRAFSLALTKAANLDCESTETESAEAESTEAESTEAESTEAESTRSTPAVEAPLDFPDSSRKRVRVRQWQRWGALVAMLTMVVGAAWMLRVEGALDDDVVQVVGLQGETADSLLGSGAEVEILQPGGDETASTPSFDELMPSDVVGIEESSRSSSSTLTLSFVLSLATHRGQETSIVRVVPETADMIRLQLDLDGDSDYSSFRVRVTNNRGQEVWSEGRPTLTELDWGEVVELELPAPIFDSGRYQVDLSGVDSEGRSRDIGFYDLEIAPR